MGSAPRVRRPRLPRRPSFLCGSGDEEDSISEEEDLLSPVTNGEGYSLPASVFSEDSVPEGAVIADSSINLEEEVSNSFLTYALSIITGRALPDVRDGLKPVHRRILFVLSSLNLRSNTPHRKCARVVGETLGKYHPHGDTSVYDALVRMAQDFSAGTPLVDGHGNFGSVDGDPPAAMRYTECRLSRAAEDCLLSDLGEGEVVPYGPNFDGSETEPAVLPARVPMLLLNGCAGIAVGMATNVPPHNLAELCDACAALLDARDADAELSDAELYAKVPAPDFPTGATLLGTEAARELYGTGRGSVTMRATTNTEEVRSGTRTRRTAIVVTELPYGVNKATLMENIAGLVNERKIEGVADLRDESDRDGIRVVIELKRDAVVDIVRNNLFKKTALQTNFAGNFLALFPGKEDAQDGDGAYAPRRFTLRSALDAFLNFRFLTVRKRSQIRLTRAASRAHIVDGLLQALERVDEVVEVARSAASNEEARQLLEEKIGMTRKQCDAVLKLQLGQLTRMNANKLTSEREELKSKISLLEDLMSNDHSVRKVMKNEMAEIKERHGVPRRTVILPQGDDAEMVEEDFVKNARSVIMVTNGGYIKRMPLTSFESQNRGTRGKRGTNPASPSADDLDASSSDVAHCFTCNDHDTLLVITQRGVAFGIRAHRVPEFARTARGAPLPSVLPVGRGEEAAAILPVTDFSEPGKCIVLATERGWIKRTPLDAFAKITSRGLIIASLEEGDVLRWCDLAEESDDVLLGTARGLATRFRMADLRPTGRTSRGVKSMKLKEGDRLVDMSIVAAGEKGDEETFVLMVTEGGYGKRVLTEDFKARGRGGVGVIAIKFKAGSDDASKCLRIVRASDEILLVTEHGVIVRQKVDAISVQSRPATGMLLQKVDGGDAISSVSIVPKKILEEGDQSAADDKKKSSKKRGSKAASK